jgi:hypothetical protein
MSDACLTGMAIGLWRTTRSSSLTEQGSYGCGAAKASIRLDGRSTIAVSLDHGVLGRAGDSDGGANRHALDEAAQDLGSLLGAEPIRPY